MKPLMALHAIACVALVGCGNASPPTDASLDLADRSNVEVGADLALDVPYDTTVHDATTDTVDLVSDASTDAPSDAVSRPVALTFYPGTVAWREDFTASSLPAGWRGQNTTYAPSAVSLPDGANYGSCAGTASILTSPAVGASQGYDATRVYSLVWTMRASAVPVTVATTVTYRNASGAFVLNGATDWDQNSGTSNETYVLTFAAPAGRGIADVSFQWQRLAQGGAGASLVIESVQLVEGEPVSAIPKTPFVGDRVRVDANGNVQVASGGTWSDYFPFGVYDPTFGSSPITLAQAASDGFNFDNTNDVSGNTPCTSQPAGLLTVEDVVGHLDPRFALCYADDFSCWPSDPLTYDANCQCTSASSCKYVLPSEGSPNLQTAVNTALGASGCADGVLYWYYDNEENVAVRQHEAYTLIRMLDASAGTPDRPFFMNQGRPGMVRGHAADIDTFGSYHNGPGDMNERIFDALVPRPYTTAVRSIDATTQPSENRALSWAAVAAGAHGLTFYRWPDFGSNAALVTSITSLRHEIDGMGEWIRAARAAWSPMPDSVSMASVVLSGREISSGRFVMAVNPTGALLTTHATLQAGATATTLTEVSLGSLAPTGTSIAVASDGVSFDVTLAAWDVVLYRVD